jgi:hypothetical protein
MIPAAVLPLVVAQAVRPRSTGKVARNAKGAPGAFWASLRPLAFLAPLAVNWPGGRMAP